MYRSQPIHLRFVSLRSDGLLAAVFDTGRRVVFDFAWEEQERHHQGLTDFSMPEVKTVTISDDKLYAVINGKLLIAADTIYFWGEEPRKD